MQDALDKLDEELKGQRPPAGASVPSPAGEQSGAARQAAQRRDAQGPGKFSKTGSQPNLLDSGIPPVYYQACL